MNINILKKFKLIFFFIKFDKYYFMLITVTK